MYKGIIKVTYDRGYALQTKSLLVESTTTVAEAVVQLFRALGLRGAPVDYALEERNIMTGGGRGGRGEDLKEGWSVGVRGEREGEREGGREGVRREREKLVIIIVESYQHTYAELPRWLSW